MAEAAVVDASPLIILARAGRLDLLQLAAQRIVVPSSVVAEVGAHSHEANRALSETAWLERVPDVPTSAAIAGHGPGHARGVPHRQDPTGRTLGEVQGLEGSAFVDGPRLTRPDNGS